MKEYIGRDIFDEDGNVVGREYSGELIRCKDCIYARMTIDGDSAKYCLAWQDTLTDSLYLPADFYCAYAERKEE